MKIIDVTDQNRPDPRLLRSEFAESLALDRYEHSLDRRAQRLRKRLEILRRLLEERQ